MTFKEFISVLFEKWTCKHDWERWQTVHVTDDLAVLTTSIILNVINVVNLRK